MASINKVCYNIDQTNDTNSTEKKQARDNIAASQINYITATGGTPVVNTGDLNIVTYQSGLHLNDGNGNISHLPPETTSGAAGKILTVNNDGSINWRDNQPVRDVFIDQQTFLGDGNESATKLLWQVELPKKNGKYPTKVIGSVATNPATDGTVLSILPMQETIYDYTYEVEYEPGVTGTVSATNYKPFNSGSIVNYQHLLALTDTQSSVPNDGEYESVCPFQFKDASQHPGRDMKFVAIKGSNACPDYNLHNIQITCFYEQGDN